VPGERFKLQPYQRQAMDNMAVGGTLTNTMAGDLPTLDSVKLLQDILGNLEANNEWLCFQEAANAVGVGSMFGIMNMTNLQFLKVTILEEVNRAAAGIPPRMGREAFAKIRQAAFDDPHGSIFPDPPKRGLA
jgi:hypothetical protein